MASSVKVDTGKSQLLQPDLVLARHTLTVATEALDLRVEAVTSVHQCPRRPAEGSSPAYQHRRGPVNEPFLSTRRLNLLLRYCHGLGDSIEAVLDGGDRRLQNDDGPAVAGARGGG